MSWCSSSTVTGTTGPSGTTALAGLPSDSKQNKQNCVAGAMKKSRMHLATFPVDIGLYVFTGASCFVQSQDKVG